MNKKTLKLGIYLCAILMMGVIAVSSNIANIVAAFPEAGQTRVISYLISIPCLIVIPMTLVSGKLMDVIPKKTLMILGVLLWLIGGCMPYFIPQLTAILIMRCIFGIGLGLVMSTCPALVVENFEDPAERDRTMGTMTAFQMLGAIIFSILAGNLGSIRWNLAFLVHLMAIISLIAAITFLPSNKGKTSTTPGTKNPFPSTAPGTKAPFQPTTMMWTWCIAFLVFMMAGQAYSNYASSIITELNLGDVSSAGYSLALFSLGGLVMGFLFANLAKILKAFTLTFGCALLAISYIIMAIPGNIMISYVGAIICGLSFSICMPCILNGAGNAVTLASSAMAVSIATCMQNAGQALSPYLIGSLSNHISIGNYSHNQCAMFTGAIIAGILALVFILIQRKHH